jgi:hypothetical protein
MVLSLEDMSGFGAVLHIAGSVLIVYGQTIVKVAHCIEESSGLGSTWLIPPGVRHHPRWYVVYKCLVIAQHTEHSNDFKHNFFPKLHLNSSRLPPPPPHHPLLIHHNSLYSYPHFPSIQAPSRWKMEKSNHRI